MKPNLIKQKCPAIRETCKAIEACACAAIWYVEDKRKPLGDRFSGGGYL